MRGVRAGRLRFTTETAAAVGSAEIIFITVGMPSRADRDADVTDAASVADVIASALNDYRLIVEKRTMCY